jgi:hypothetical protein
MGAKGGEGGEGGEEVVVGGEEVVVGGEEVVGEADQQGIGPGLDYRPLVAILSEAGRAWEGAGLDFGPSLYMKVYDSRDMFPPEYEDRILERRIMYNGEGRPVVIFVMRDWEGANGQLAVVVVEGVVETRPLANWKAWVGNNDEAWAYLAGNGYTEMPPSDLYYWLQMTGESQQSGPDGGRHGQRRAGRLSSHGAEGL